MSLPNVAVVGKLVRAVGRKMEVSPVKSKLRLDAIAFNISDIDWRNDITQIKLVYRLDINTFRGFTRIQLLVEYMEYL